MTFRLAPDFSAFDFPSSREQGQPEERLPEGLVLQFEAQLPVIVYTHTLEPIGEDELVELPPPFGLTAREWEVACLLMSGLGTSEIAGEMQIAYATIRAHIRDMLEALGASTRTQALMRLWSRCGTPDVAGFSQIRSASRGRH